MKGGNIGHRASAWVVVWALLVLPLGQAMGSDCETWAGRLVSVQGTVEARTAGSEQWGPVASGATFCPGDTLRVGANSRAGVILPSETLVRLDQLSTISFSESKREGVSLLELLRGLGHFISRVPQSLEVETPFVNAAVEGTEFLVEATAEQGRVLVFEGTVVAVSPGGRELLGNGEGALARPGEAPRKFLIAKPRNAVKWALYYPPVARYPSADLPGELRAAAMRFAEGDIEGALAQLEGVPAGFRDARFHSLRASIRLFVGRVDEAGGDIERALELDPASGDALALKSIVTLVLGDREEAMRLAEEAARLEPSAAAPFIALSYTDQARFDLERARQNAKTATDLEPENALAWARLAELRLAFVEYDKAQRAARRATELNPRLARTQTILGFAQLLRFRADDAIATFERAIALDEADPLPRLGLGLAKIRRGDLKEGRRNIEIATSLDPGSSVVRSYLGKAYYDERRDALAGTEFEIAQALDPNDPTPWFYDAIRKQTDNRPVEAMESLDRSIELNDNRAVYRSSLLLDSDLAARSASQARVFTDLGFDRRALLSGWDSVNADPGNWSAHRLLSDVYAQQPRQNVARTSALFQSLMLQPINTLPLQPQSQESSLPIIANSGPTEGTLNEFHPLFTRDRIRVQADGALGNNDTWGNNLVAYGLYKQFSFSAGQFHYETDGFRENNDQDEDIYNVFAQFAVTPKLSLQAEYRRRESEQGDLALRFDPDLFSPTLERKVNQDVARAGVRFAPNRRSTFLGSVLYADRNGKRSDTPAGAPGIEEDDKVDGYQSELLYLYRRRSLNVTAGGAWYDLNQDSLNTFDWTPIFGLVCPPSPPFPAVVCEDSSSIDSDHKTGYIYANVSYPRSLLWTVGYSYDDLDEGDLDTENHNPKFGLQWDLTRSIRLRGAYFETVKRALIVEQTLEPTQVAGFTQFFDQFSGTETKTRGMGVDWRVLENLFVGAEALHRDIDRPQVIGGQVDFADRDEDAAGGYVYWAPWPRVALNAGYDFNDVNSDGFGFARPAGVRTRSVPLSARYFSPIGLFAGLGVTRVSQTVRYEPSDSGDPPLTDQNKDEFWVTDVVLGYRLPKRWGIASVEVNNLFDEDFFYQDDNYRTSEPVAPRFIPERTVVGKLSLSF